MLGNDRLTNNNDILNITFFYCFFGLNLAFAFAKLESNLLQMNTPATVAKDLEVILDPCLTYNDHIASTVSGCMARQGQINPVKHTFDSTTLTIIVTALVFSKLCYCCNVWSNTSEYNLSRIQAVQNFAAHIVSNSRKYDHISPVLKDLK